MLVFVLLRVSLAVSFAQLLQVKSNLEIGTLYSKSVPPALSCPPLPSFSLSHFLFLLSVIFKPKHPLCAVNSHSR